MTEQSPSERDHLTHGNFCIKETKHLEEFPESSDSVANTSYSNVSLSQVPSASA